MIIKHWRYEDGVPRKQLGLFPPDPIPAGYYCWAYPDDHNEFDEWMTQTYERDDREYRAGWEHRFNSGDPMFTVYIKSEQDAMLFQLRWKDGSNHD